MKTLFQYLIVCGLLPLCCIMTSAQGIVISEDANAMGSPSAILDVQSGEKGFLPPRMTTTERETIATPADGLIVYDTDESKLLLYRGMEWVDLSAAGSRWEPDGADIYRMNGRVGIGTNDPLHLFHVETAASGSESRAIYGLASAASGFTFGVLGESNSTSGSGVYGLVSSSSGYTTGVYGQSNSTSGIGVIGATFSDSGTTFGVLGESNSTSGSGVYGLVYATSGTTYGVLGESRSTSGHGVYGLVSSSSGYTTGVYGQSNSTSGTGVIGASFSDSGTTFGVLGESNSTSGRGVSGVAYANSGTTYGVRGHTNSPDGFAGYFTGTSGSRNYFQRSVGIGTESPARLLHVRTGSSGAGSNANTVAVFESAGNTYISTLSAADRESGILFSIPANSAHGGIIYNSSSTSGGMQLRTGGNVTRMTILSGGDVGIGTQSPSQRLHVTGNICYTGSISACSDSRYKTAFTPLKDVLPKITSVGTYTYRWKLEEYPDKGFDDRPQIGIVAQEIRDVFPELIVTDGDGYLSVDYSRLSVLLLAAIREQQEIIDTLRATIVLQQEQSALQSTQIGSLMTEMADIRTLLEHNVRKVTGTSH